MVFNNAKNKKARAKEEALLLARLNYYDISPQTKRNNLEFSLLI